MSTSRASELNSGTSKESAASITKVNQSSTNHNNIDLEKCLALQLSKITAKKSSPGGDVSAGIAVVDRNPAGLNNPAQKMRDYRSSRGTSAHCMDMAAAVVQAAVQEQQQQLTQQQLALAVQAVQNSNNGALVSLTSISLLVLYSSVYYEC